MCSMRYSTTPRHPHLWRVDEGARTHAAPGGAHTGETSPLGQPPDQEHHTADTAQVLRGDDKTDDCGKLRIIYDKQYFIHL